MKKSALVVLSGGQDSTTCLVWALNNPEFHSVKAITLDYGQKHIKEIEQAEKICKELNVSWRCIKLDKEFLKPSSLTKHNLDHNNISSINENLPASFTMGRNILFTVLSACMQDFSYKKDYRDENGFLIPIYSDIVLGVCQTDYSGYPDCRRTTIDALQLTLSLGLGIGDIKIHTPLMYLTKAETWKLAKDLGYLDFIIKNTITDYNGDMTENPWGFGSIDNPATKLRANGYYEAKQKGWI
jgi:7-cyano-7-deazaguanine synthase